MSAVRLSDGSLHAQRNRRPRAGGQWAKGVVAGKGQSQELREGRPSVILLLLLILILIPTSPVPWDGSFDSADSRRRLRGCTERTVDLFVAAAHAPSMIPVVHGPRRFGHRLGRGSRDRALHDRVGRVAVAGARADWPEFRGPTGDGHAAASDQKLGVPLKWSEQSNIKWKTAIPHRGWSTPVVLGGQVWVTTASEAGHDYYAIGLDAETGAIRFNERVFHDGQSRTARQWGVHERLCDAVAATSNRDGSTSTSAAPARPVSILPPARCSGSAMICRVAITAAPRPRSLRSKTS